MFRRLLIIITCLLCLISNSVQAADQRAILDLRINGVRKDEVAVWLRNGDVLVRDTDLQAAGLQELGRSRELVNGVAYVPLSSLAPNLLYVVDDANLSLNLTVNPAVLGHRVETYNNRPPEILYSQDTSGFLNYSLNLRDLTKFTAFTETGVTVGPGLLYNAISRNEHGAVVRGLSNLTISNRESMNRTVIGDRLITSNVLGGNPIMGGVSFFRDFNLDPYFVRNPGLNYSGAVATPSTVDVYVNGQLMRRVSLPPGEFQFKDLPVPAGVGDTRLVLRDAFGREQEISSQNYFTSTLLKEGLQEFNYSIGYRREDLDTESWKYDKLVMLALHRLGITEYLTAGMRLEATSRLVSGGPSIGFRMPFGEMEIAGGFSAGDGASGGAGYIGYNYLGRSLNFGWSARIMSPHYATTTLSANDKRALLQINTLIGFPVTTNLGVTLRYTYENSQIDGRANRLSMAASARVTDRISYFLSGGVLKQSTGLSKEIFSGLTFLFGETTAALSYQKYTGTNTGLMTVQKSLPVGTGFGYRFQAAPGGDASTPTVDTLLQYQGPYGRYEANYSRLASQNSTVLNVAGGVAMIGGDYFFSRPVQDSFAVIDVAGIGGVRGYSNNQEIGRSNGNGNLFIPNLLPYYGNKVAIADLDVPMNYMVDKTEKFIAPPYRGGAVVKFPVQRIQRISGEIELDDAHSTRIPAFGQVLTKVNNRVFESPVGRKGEFYFENLPPGQHSAVLDYEDHHCDFRIDIPIIDRDEIQLGKLTCRLN